jgi:hypothetical protein
VFDEINGANQEANERNRQAIDKQMDKEARARRWPLDVYEALQRQASGQPGLQYFGPDSAEPDPAWAQGVSVEPKAEEQL